MTVLLLAFPIMTMVGPNTRLLRTQQILTNTSKFDSSLNLKLWPNLKPSSIGDRAKMKMKLGCIAMNSAVKVKWNAST